MTIAMTGPQHDSGDEILLATRAIAWLGCAKFGGWGGSKEPIPLAALSDGYSRGSVPKTARVREGRSLMTLVDSLLSIIYFRHDVTQDMRCFPGDRQPAFQA